MCKLIDKNRDSLGAPQFVKRFKRAKESPERVARLEAAVKKLEEELNPVLKRYRDTRLAHVGTAEFAVAHPPLEPAIRAAVAVVDEIRGSRTAYASFDVDLRREVLTEPPRE